MLRSALHVRVTAPLALLALTLGMPSVAVADATPTPSPTTSASSSPTATATASPAPTPSETASATPSPSHTQAPSTTAPSTPALTAPLSKAPAAEPLKTSPFGLQSSARRIAGTPSQQAAYAGGFMVRTLAANGDHYNYPDSEWFDGGNTIDAIIGLDGAQVGRDGADKAFAYVEDNLGGYIGTEYDSLYAGPAGKALVAVVTHGGDVNDFGGLDLVDVLLNESLGAVEPGRFSDLPTECGFDVCDYSNTIGQALDLIGVGMATGEVPDVAMDYLLEQQCADGGFRGTLGGTTCVSDLDATGFAAQALVGRYGPDDDATIKALDYLASKQAANGGLLNQDGQSNANTTGVAAQAFTVGGYADERVRAQSFLASLQLDCSAAAGLRGGIAFTASDRATLVKSPKDTNAFDRMVRATPQATLGLAGGSLLDATVEGSAATAPVLKCAKPSPTATATSTATVSPEPTVAPSTATPSAAPVTHAPVAEAAAAPGLAYTGSSLGGPLSLAVLLLLAGAAAILAARRRGAHR
jgi:hypothetical protein